jgi:hypothetical protein
MKSGQALRRTEIQAVAGKGGDVKRASDSHKRVLAEAVHEARKLAAGASLHPDIDVLSTMLEALSVASKGPDRPGRLTELVQPAGFEAFGALGVRPAETPTEKDAAREQAQAAAREQEAARQRKEAEHRVRAAEQTVEENRIPVCCSRSSWLSPPRSSAPTVRTSVSTSLRSSAGADGWRRGLGRHPAPRSVD